MPTKARFGRLPRQSPSLTSTIVALAQEYQRVRESNIVDAWKNGGMFEGHKVTDDMVMKWFKDRRNELSRDDPKWDYYDNQLTQYEFAIANSKMELHYKQKTASDGDMVAFYHKWAAKLPPDSEAYREREKLAAAYADRGRATGAAGRRAAEAKAYAAHINADFKKEFTYDAVLTFLNSEAHNRGILEGNESLNNIDPLGGDGARITALWDEIANAPEYAKDRAFFTAQIRKNGDPHFNGDFSQDAFNSYDKTKQAGVTDRIATARKAGRQTDVKNFTAEQQQVRGTKVLTAGFDETVAYEQARKDWIDVFTNPAATALEKDRANAKYTGELTNIRDRLQAGIRPGEVDPRLGLVNNELLTMSGDEKPLDHWAGAFGPGGNQGGAGATETAQGVNEIKQRIHALGLRDANGDPLWVQTKVVNGDPVNTTPDTQNGLPWGVVARDKLPEHTTFVVQNDYGDPRAGQVITAVVPTPIFISTMVQRTDASGAPTGEPVQQQSEAPAAYNYTMPDGKTGYKYQDGAGNWLYTPDNPFGVLNPDGSTSENRPNISSKQGTLTVPGIATVMPGTSTTILPSYYNPAANVAMTSRIGKSGYAMWLIASDPHDRAAYTQTNDEIMTSLKLDANGDVNALNAMIVDVDGHRAVYLGNSTVEQQRVRINALTGTPDAVPITDALPRVGYESPASAEQKMRDFIAAGGTTAEATAAARADAAASNKAINLDPWQMGAVDTRKYSLSPTPPNPLGQPTVSPTSLGSAMPVSLAQTLAQVMQNVTQSQNVIGAVTGAPKPTAPTPVKPFTLPTQPGYTPIPLPTAPSVPLPKVPTSTPVFNTPIGTLPVSTPEPIPVEQPGYHNVFDQHGNLVGQKAPSGRVIL